MVSLPKASHNIKVLDRTCPETGCKLLQIDFHKEKTPLPDGSTKYIGSILADDFLQNLITWKFTGMSYSCMQVSCDAISILNPVIAGLVPIVMHGCRGLGSRSRPRPRARTWSPRARARPRARPREGQGLQSSHEFQGLLRCPTETYGVRERKHLRTSPQCR
eukprot:scaffold447_cov384-Prasinococcus_capsulatus_cf.AAC.5